MSRKLFVLLAVFLLTLSIAACGNTAETTDEGDTSTPAEETTPSDEESTDEEMTDEEPADEEPADEEPADEEPADDEATGDESSEDMSGDTLVMSFVPSGDSQEIVTSGEEIAALLSEATGMQIEANVATSYAAVVEAMCAGQADVGWLNTFSYILAAERGCADVSLATERFGSTYYTGQIIVNADSGIESLDDIGPDTTVCWVDELSTSGYIIPQITMEAAGIDTEALDAQFLGSHDNVVNGVYNGDCEVGATFVDARTGVEDELPDVMEKVLVIEESPEIPNDTVSFASDVPDDVKETLTQAMLELAGSDAGAAALQAVYEIDGLEATDDAFYDGFRTQLDAAGVNVEDLAQE